MNQQTNEVCIRQRLFCILYGIYRSLLPVSAETLETERAVNQCKQGIIAALAYVDTGMNPGTALTVDDVAGFDELTVSPLCAKALGLGITAVLCGAHSLFMSEELKI